MLRPRHPGFFEEIGTGDIEILGDSRFVEKFSFDAEADISEDVTLFKRSTVKRAPPRLPKSREQVTNLRPIPEALLRRVREHARASVAPTRRIGESETQSRIRRWVVLPWPAAVMILAVLTAVTIPHARRGDTRGALLYTLSSTRTAMKALTHPVAVSSAQREAKATRTRAMPPIDEYWTITFAAPAAPTAPAPAEPQIAAPPKTKPVVAKTVVAKTEPAASTKTPRAEAAKADALVRAQLQ